MTSIRKWIARISRYIDKILSPEVNGGNNYKKGRKDFDSRNTLWKGYQRKGALSARVNKDTDFASQEYVNDSAWKEFMNDNEFDITFQLSSNESQLSTTRRIRPPNQTEEKKKAWDEERRLISVGGTTLPPRDLAHMSAAAPINSICVQHPPSDYEPSALQA